MTHTVFINTASLEYPLHEGDLRLRFPDMQEFFIPEGYAGVESVESPLANMYEAVVEDPPVLVDGKWTQRLHIRPYTAEERQQLDDMLRLQIVPDASLDMPGGAPNVIG
jgi:hypothetical protein